MPLPLVILVAGTLLAAAAVRPVSAQHGAPPEAVPADRLQLRAHGIALFTHATPAISGRALSELYLTQPLLAAQATLRDGRVELQGVLNLEGLTLGRGELNAGVWGEGYIDRRHPHTYLHEAVVTVMGGRAAGFRYSLAGGRGFVPFGTDDPMARPFVKFPANHHLAQVLERWILAGAAAAGRLRFEAALLNGDEPTSPADVGGLSRVGDSWAARLTVLPVAALELQVSRAFLASPELRGGGGADQHKTSASAAWRSTAGEHPGVYALVEGARTAERADGRPGHAFRSALAEVELRRRRAVGALRIERTERPEEERTFDPFRTPPAHLGPLLGITEWTIVTGRVGRTIASHGIAAEPFAEVARLYVRETRGGIFRPTDLYGSDRHWSLSAGVRLGAGAGHGRMGRYGAAALPHAPDTRRPAAHRH